MTDNSVLERYTRSAAKVPERLPTSLLDAVDPDETEDFGAFGWLRGIRDRAIMLELRKKDGSIRAVGNAWLQEATFDPSVGITLVTPGGKIRLLGRNLNAETRPQVRLFSGLTRHRVPWIQEADEATLMRAADRETVIEQIEW